MRIRLEVLHDDGEIEGLEIIFAGTESAEIEMAKQLMRDIKEQWRAVRDAVAKGGS